MNITKTYIAPLWPPFLLLTLTNLLGLIFPLPVIIQMLLNACISIHLACLISSSLTKVSYRYIKQCQDQITSNKQSTITCNYLWQILKYPLMGCLILFGLYYIVKNSQKIDVQTLLDVVFVILIVFYGGAKVHLLALWFCQVIDVKEKMNQNIWSLIQKTSKYLFCPLLSLLLALAYVQTKHWLLNNIFGLFLTIGAIKYGGIKSFKLAVPILWSLFIYDMYWVYSTDVMVTVAKAINLPLKLQFPYLNMVGQIQFSLLGLGDIIIPGLFLSLCFKYDIDNIIVSRRKQNMRQFGMKLYNIAFFFYILGLFLTYTALYVFKHPQPALVFIVPCLTLSLLFNKFLGKRLPLSKYNSSTMSKSEQELSRV